MHCVLHLPLSFFCLGYSTLCPNSHILLHSLLLIVPSLSVSFALVLLLSWNKMNISNISNMSISWQPIRSRLTYVRNLRKLWPILVRELKQTKSYLDTQKICKWFMWNISVSRGRMLYYNQNWILLGLDIDISSMQYQVLVCIL